MNRSYHFPFVVTSNGVGVFVFEREGERGVRYSQKDNGRRIDLTNLPIAHFLECNEKYNPNNDSDKDYHISQGYGPKVIDYAEETARNMFGRDESRCGFHTGGYVSRNFMAKSRKASDTIPRGRFDLDGVIMSMAGGSLYLPNATIKDGTVSAAKLQTHDELRKEVERLTGELTAAHATIAKVREALRTQPGEDVQAHAKVLRQMADALVKLWQGE